MNDFRIAWFITPHGFGHGARAAAVMEALARLESGARHEVFTAVPTWFFRESVERGFSIHPVKSDVGLVQKSPFLEDLPATLEALRAFYPLDPSLTAGLARTVEAQGCTHVVSDVSPLGIVVARAAGLPSILVENFTWDWIYRGYIEEDDEFEDFAFLIEEIVESADYRIRTEPVCGLSKADLTVPPVARRPRTPAAATRRALGIAEGEKLVLITAGGIPSDFSAITRSSPAADCHLVVPGGAPAVERHEKMTLLPFHSEFYHPDLIAAADAVVGKSGYSTLAEACLAGVPFGFVGRRRFPESPVLGDFILKRMSGIEIPQEDFQNGSWTAFLPALLSLPRSTPPAGDGAEQVARFIREVPIR